MEKYTQEDESVILKSTEYVLAVLQVTVENNHSLKYCLWENFVNLEQLG